MNFFIFLTVSSPHSMFQATHDLIWFNLAGAGQGISHDDYPQDGSEQLLPRPLLVIKGTTPTTVTLEWEWTLLSEQIAGADIVYSVLILGSKFHSNINSSFWYVTYVISEVKCLDFSRQFWKTQNGDWDSHGGKRENCGRKKILVTSVLMYD